MHLVWIKVVAVEAATMGIVEIVNILIIDIVIAEVVEKAEIILV